VFLALAQTSFPRTASKNCVSDKEGKQNACVCCGHKTIPLPHAGPGTRFHQANRARARASPAPKTPAGLSCVAWLEGFEDEDVLVVEDTTEAALRVLVGDVVLGVLVVDVDEVVVKGVVLVAVVKPEVPVSVAVEVSVVEESVVEVSVAREEEPEAVPLQRDKKNASAA